MKKIWLVCCLLSSFVLLAAPRIRATRPDAVYKVGEDIVFNIMDAPANAQYRISDSNVAGKFVKLEGSTVTFKARKPGFVLLELKVGKSRPVYGGAAVEPEKIVPGVSRPADFDAYWDNELKQLRAHKLEVIKKIPVPADKLPKGFIGFDVHVKRGDVVVSGYVVLPAGKKAKSLPARLSFNGASKVSANIASAAGGAKASNAIAMNINFHGLENSFNRSDALIRANRKKVAFYQFNNANDRQKYAMRKIFLRTVVAADYLMSLPEYNGTLGVSGGSLGGCQAIICAALVPEVKYCVSTGTAMCDHFGAKAGHLSGWPKLLERDRTPKGAEAVAPYFDVVNFASRIKCPVVMSVGFIDVTCPPASTYAAYNSLTTANRKMHHVVTAGHGQAWDKKEGSVFGQGGNVFSKWLRNAR